MGNEMRNGNGDCGYYSDGGDHYNGLDRGAIDKGSCHSNRMSPAKQLPTSSSAAVNFIEHPVSKLDTLAGVAIKYGVEVGDIKRMNGLVTDHQMFALKSLQIPLPGRHPPSPCVSNGAKTPGHTSSEQIPTSSLPSDLLESFPPVRAKSSQRKVSPAMSYLQGYYGTKPTEPKTTYEGFEMAVYKKEGGDYLENGASPQSDPTSMAKSKSKSFVNGFLNGCGEVSSILQASEAGDGDPEKTNEKLVRRRQRSAADLSSTPELLLKEDGGGSGGFSSASAAKGLSLRPKAASKTASANDGEAGGLSPIPIGFGDSLIADGFSAVRKSSSASSLQDQESGGSSIWSASKWSLKPDLQAISTAAIARPIFDGLPKPITGRWNKAALD